MGDGAMFDAFRQILALMEKRAQGAPVTSGADQIVSACGIWRHHLAMAQTTAQKLRDTMRALGNTRLRPAEADSAIQAVVTIGLNFARVCRPPKRCPSWAHQMQHSRARFGSHGDVVSASNALHVLLRPYPAADWVDMVATSTWTDRRRLLSLALSAVVRARLASTRARLVSRVTQVTACGCRGGTFSETMGHNAAWGHRAHADCHFKKSVRTLRRIDNSRWHS